VTLAQAEPARLGETSHSNKGEFLVFSLKRELLARAKPSEFQSFFTCKTTHFMPKLQFTTHSCSHSSIKHPIIQS